jgi:broad specificity phosphatase PhoE
MQTLWLIRHADRLDFVQPEWFETASYPYDPPLSSIGLDSAIRLAQQLGQVPVQRIFTSPFLRTIQTADPLARQIQVPIQMEWGLCEWLCQDWTPALPDTTPIEDLRKDFPAIDCTYRSLVIPCYPETHEELDARIRIIARKLIQNNSENILAIAHKGSVLGIAAVLTGDSYWRTYDLACGGIIKLVRIDRDWQSTNPIPNEDLSNY